MSALSQVLTPEKLRELAGAVSFRRGQLYAAEGRVGTLVVRGNTLSATVAGTRSYQVRIEARDGGLDHRCSCPVGADGAFCKHTVAVALSWIAGRRSDKPGRDAGASSVVTLDDLRPWLLRQTPENLADLLLGAAERDERLRERLLRDAARATGKRNDFAAYRRAIDRATLPGEFIAYDEACESADNIHQAAVVPLRELLNEGHAAEVVDLAEHALARVEQVIEQVDDSDGHFGTLLDELQELHLKACRAAKPDPEALAARLFDWEMREGWGVFHGAAQTYARVLGRKGLAAYRARAEATWSKLPALGPDRSERFDGGRYRITHIMESLARATGDVDEVIAVKAKNLSHAYAFLQIAEICRDAKRFDAALDWAERGLKAFPKDTDARLLEFLAAEYHRRGRHDDAIAMGWRQFESRPALDTYHTFKGHVDCAGAEAWPAWHERALDLLRQRIASAQPDSRRPVQSLYAVADRSTLVEIFLWEENVEAAWQAAQTGECRGDILLHLAAAREATHPADAIPIYLRVAESLVAQMNNDAYAKAARHLAHVKSLHLALGQPDAWVAVHARVCTTHKAKRNFMTLARRL